MQVMKVSKGDYVARRQDKVMEWLLIQEGSVVEKFGFAEMVLGKNAIIGILESEWFFCDYIAKEDTTLIRLPCTNSEDLQNILEENEKYRLLFLHTAIEQRQQALVVYRQLFQKTNELFRVAGEAYENYKQICEELFVREQPFSRMEGLHALQMQHKVDEWEMRNSESLVKNHFREYLQLMMKDDAMCVGAIMEASAQVRRATLGIGEMVKYLQYNKDILLAESEEDLFHLYFDTAVSVAKRKQDITPFQTRMDQLLDVMERLDIYDNKQLQNCRDISVSYDFESVSKGRVNVLKEDCVAHILAYADYEKSYILEFKQWIQIYKEGKRKGIRDDETNKARKWIGEQFFEVYAKVFLRVMGEQEKLSPILAMFLNFGFMDVGLLGEEYTNELFNMVDQLGLFSGEHVFTIFEWLKAIYNGKREPSKNELDVDYQEFLMQQKKHGEITEAEWKAQKEDPVKKVEYEIANMFRSGQRMTYGRVTSFMPILQEDDLLQSLRNMAITTERVESALNYVRRIDYTALYREITFSDPEKGIPNERIRKEVIPDIILFPT
ncbi:MAG: cyclic nucleotide-binding domain-containing protein, partial [Eubacterium sp.]|nr:cyclic nucleotide-binding domain-containing protein [Eubacterium sp.]